ncbi:MAG: hypothetical protein KGK07_13435 [Chloroflexota bacterium]|nr:hypothetical protein [Chloroflexota bacterium]
MTLPVYNAIDLSYSTLRPEAIPPRVNLVIQNLWDGVKQPAPRVTNLRAALAAGKQIAGYVVLTGRGGDLSMARSGVPDDIWAALWFVALDVELAGVTSPDIEQALTMLRVYGRLERVIYTRRGYWETSGLVAPPDTLLWDARYAGDDGIVPPFVPYGGWTEATLLGTQVRGTTAIAPGVDADLNWIDLSKLGGTTVTDTTQTLAARQYLAGAALSNDMEALVRLLVYFGVLPAGTAALKAAISG